MVLLILMFQERRSALTAILLISGIFLGFGLFANIPALYKGFLVGDQAVYYCMAQSLAYDGDLEYTTKDLIRYNEDFWAGPNGIFLKKVVKDGRERLYYAKSFAYSLFAAPFVRVFGPSGPLVFNGLLLFLLLLMGWSYFALANSPGLAARQDGRLSRRLGRLPLRPLDHARILQPVPRLHRPLPVAVQSRSPQSPSRCSAARPPFRTGPLEAVPPVPGARITWPPSSAGLVIFSKPTNIVLTAPLFLSTLLVGKKFWKAVALGLVSLVVAGRLLRRQLGLDRRVELPGRRAQELRLSVPAGEERRHLRQRARPDPMTTDGYVERGSRARPSFCAYNLFWYFFGRFTGIAWYFFPAVLLFLFSSCAAARASTPGSSWPPLSARSWSTWS